MLTICKAEIDGAFGTSKTSDDPDKVVALGPRTVFFIYGKATDAVGNGVGSSGTIISLGKLTASADNASDAEKSLDS